MGFFEEERTECLKSHAVVETAALTRAAETSFTALGTLETALCGEAATGSAWPAAASTISYTVMHRVSSASSHRVLSDAPAAFRAALHGLAHRLHLLLLLGSVGEIDLVNLLLLLVGQLERLAPATRPFFRRSARG